MANYFMRFDTEKLVPRLLDGRLDESELHSLSRKIRGECKLLIEHALSDNSKAAPDLDFIDNYLSGRLFKEAAA